MRCRVTVAEHDFDTRALAALLVEGDNDIGALATFVGLVRGGQGDSAIDAMVLEHYPAMTEKSLHKIAVKAGERWPLLGVEIYHRIGKLEPGEQIVYVGVTSKHRQAAFDACAFIMDYLKTEAPFWKKELRGGKGVWVDARESDARALDRWSH